MIGDFIRRKTRQPYTILFISILLVISSLAISKHQILLPSIKHQTQATAQVTTELLIPPHTNYVIRYDDINKNLVPELRLPLTEGLSESMIKAVIKSPSWVQPALIEQFKSMDKPEPYAYLLLNVSKQITDELAFSIAYSPLGNVPFPELLLDNVETLYEHDTWISYADIIDIQPDMPQYASTIRYTLLENGTPQIYEYPPEIYYWYVVHPKLGQEEPEFIYDSFWRAYLTNHNDRDYPLLKEKIQPFTCLWDNTSYAQQGNRLWTPSMIEHPTAIEACSYWIGKTVPAQAIGSRPGQPVIIAHEHNGWCGELARLATAAQRAILIPTIGAYNVGEDHVWREFYHQGWHQNDNYWTDSGGTVDVPDVYAYGWGKNMSAIYQWRGDDILTDVTARYIHPEDRVTVSFNIVDQFRQPVDGARVVAVVDGLKDITWYKLKFMELLNSIWDRIPYFLHGPIMAGLYKKILQKIENTPDIIDGLTITTWNYSDENGLCTLTLGKYREYLFVVQYGNLKNPWLPARKNTIRLMKQPKNKTYHVLFPMLSTRIPLNRIKRYLGGDLTLNIKFEAVGYQLQQNFRTQNIGRFETDGKIQCFVLDADNYEKYQSGRLFRYATFLESESDLFDVPLSDQEWYVVFYNPTKNTQMLTAIEINARIASEDDAVCISRPSTTLFDYPAFNIGNAIEIAGVASDTIELIINNESMEVAVENNEWSYLWQTKDLAPKTYTITAQTGASKDHLQIQLVDAEPPTMIIDTPTSYEIIDEDLLFVSGTADDNYIVDLVEVALDRGPYIPATGTTSWNVTFDIQNISIGEHRLSVRVYDGCEQVAEQSVLFCRNDTENIWKPDIHQVYYKPDVLSNTSNLVIYANITDTSPFSLQDVTLFYSYNMQVMCTSMYHYASNPVQNRHEEDPLVNQSNEPIFGRELGQFPSNTTITFWVIAKNSAQNAAISDIFSCTII